jgi:hypothetical protein
MFLINRSIIKKKMTAATLRNDQLSCEGQMRNDHFGYEGMTLLFRMNWV